MLITIDKIIKKIFLNKIACYWAVADSVIPGQISIGRWTPDTSVIHLKIKANTRSVDTGLALPSAFQSPAIGRSPTALSQARYRSEDGLQTLPLSILR